MAIGQRYHISLHKDGKWQVKGENNTKATIRTKTQGDAIIKAREVAKNQRSELIIHGRDGKIRAKDSYGNDPYPPRG